MQLALSQAANLSLCDMLCHAARPFDTHLSNISTSGGDRGRFSVEINGLLASRGSRGHEIVNETEINYVQKCRRSCTGGAGPSVGGIRLSEGTGEREGGKLQDLRSTKS